MASYGFDELEADPELARLVQFAATLCDAPSAMISLVESERQRFLVREGTETTETPRATSFCAHAMLGTEPLIVPDATQDPRFREFALVTGAAHVRFYAGAPLVSAEGAPLGALCVTDTTPRPDGLTPLQLEGLEVLAEAVIRRLFGHRRMRIADAELERSEAKFRMLADSIPDIAWSSDAEGNFDYFNRRWYEFVGSEERPEGGWDDWFHPEDRASWFDAWEQARARGEPYETEYRLKRSDGSYRWVIARGLPFKTADGIVERWFGTITDIDDGHRLSDTRELVAKELAHRIKNIFAVISGLITLRTRGHAELEAFGQEINATIRTLGRAQEFVRPLDKDGSEELSELLELLMSPYQDGAGGRVTIIGDAVPICQKVATPIALVFHEFATNATKYGALSTDKGSVSIEIEQDGEEVAIRWHERGGPRVSSPEQFGFGTRLADTAIRNQLGGKIERDWQADGLIVEITVPLARLCGAGK
ncbi:PAS domain-containing protein [Altererythrobacter arenosus]|uniref:histidine kinase n=1 Tax=Altererythrobacter arenosus TaxID=3032592 RepID=A0ABY8FYQ8_9SPHN|nr:PAS domain-containing protein [Altererythrobacter sp. CAU 1644]WFL78426.1 PAS domain-containing protein [Altererythrobacter sp. CAU 1644]